MLTNKVALITGGARGIGAGIARVMAGQGAKVALLDLDGADARAPRDRRRRGLSHVPEDRHRMGLVIPFAARESAILGYHDETAYNGPIRLHRAAVRAADHQP